MQIFTYGGKHVFKNQAWGEKLFILKTLPAFGKDRVTGHENTFYLKQQQTNKQKIWNTSFQNAELQAVKESDS